MSKRILGVVPKSGEAMLKDAIGQFKGIISQIEEGVKKVTAKVTKNKERAAKIEAENARLVTAIAEAENAQKNLQAILNGTIMTLPTEDEAAEADETVEADATEESEKSE